MNKREKCYGFIHDGKKGCRWLETSPSESQCFSCHFFKTAKDFYADQVTSSKTLKNKGLMKTVKLVDGVSIVSTTEDNDY